MNKVSAAAILAVAAVAAETFGAMLVGTEPKEWPANPQKHTISITREASDDIGKKMIEAAEKARPESGQWWVVKDGEPVLTCGLKTPHAITKGALDYYTEKIKEFQGRAWKQYMEPSSSLVYKASVSHAQEFSLNGQTYNDVYVVHMALTVNVAMISDVSGTTFMKKRTVVVDKSGVPQSIAGDADETFPVWMM